MSECHKKLHVAKCVRQNTSIGRVRDDQLKYVAYFVVVVVVVELVVVIIIKPGKLPKCVLKLIAEY